jgi:hypothetical protein
VGIVKIEPEDNPRARIHNGQRQVLAGRHQTVNIQEKNTQNSSAHLSTVKELLAQLDLMKNDGIGAQKRLEYILEHGKEVVPEFDFRDAFDLELEASSKRATSLNHMDSDLVGLQDKWKVGPFRDAVKEAGQKLLEHLIKFIADAQNQERKTELHLLSQLWEWAPDLRHLYPWLTEGKKPEAVKEESTLPPETKKLVEKKDELEAEVAAEFEKLAKEEEPKLLEAMKQMKPWAVQEQVVEEQRVVASVHPKPEPIPEKEDVQLEPDNDQLMVKSWGEALRELTVVPWTFRWHERNNTGIVKMWGCGVDEARLELSEVPTEVTRVKLRLYIKGEVSVHEETIPSSKVKELHEDPMGFVKKTLDSK